MSIRQISLLILKAASSGKFVSLEDSIGLFFDGSNDRITIPNNAAYALGTGDFTFEAWIKADPSQTAFPQILSNRLTGNAFSGFLLGIWSNGNPYIQLEGNNYTPPVGYFQDVRDNSCHHIAATRLTDTVTFYIDGQFHGTRYVNTNKDITTTHDLWIGWDDPNSAQTPFHGNIKERYENDQL